MKFLRELLNESVTSTDSAISQLVQNTNSLAVLYGGTLLDQANNLYAEGMHEDMKRTSKFVLGRIKAKWFTENYLSTSRHTSSITGLKNALIALSKAPRFQKVRPALLELGSLEIQADNKVRQEKQISYSEYTEQLAGMLPYILNQMAKLDINNADKLMSGSNRLRNAVEKFSNTLTKLHDTWDKEWGKGSIQPKQKEPDQSKQVLGTQNSQATAMVDQVLGNLPNKKIAHEIRQIVSRSENKLQTLQRELTKRGLV